MKKTLYFGLVLSILLLASGCAVSETETSPAPAETVTQAPTPKPTPTEEPSPSIPPRDLVFDENGELILDEYGRLANGMAAADNIDDFTTEEVMKIARYNDGALATSVCLTLSDRLLENFDETIAIIAAADPAKFNGGREHFESTCTSIGYEMYFDLEGGVISEDDCAVIFAEHDLTEAEQAVLDKVIEGFELNKNDSPPNQ